MFSVFHIKRRRSLTSTIIFATALLGVGAFFYYWSKNEFVDRGKLAVTSHTVAENSNRVESLQQLMDDPNFPENINKFEQDEPVLRKYVQFRHLTPPSKLPYNLPGTGSFANGHSNIISNLFKHKKNGTFIESGAYDGVAASNTLYLEKSLGWRGLLVECNPLTVPSLKSKQRKAWIADVCLSPKTTPIIVNFSNPTAWAPSAKIGAPSDLSPWGIKTDWTHFDVQAIPLFTLLSAINMTEVDFWSLDIEKAEFDVLKTIPFDKVLIKVIDLEVEWYSPKERLDLDEFLKSNGYSLYRDIGSDRIYTHSSFQTKHST